jgi:hypothetical protein
MASRNRRRNNRLGTALDRVPMEGRGLIQTQEGTAMADVYATITEVDPATQERLASILELRAADPQQRAMLDSYLSEIDFPRAARALEIGCDSRFRG